MTSPGCTLLAALLIDTLLCLVIFALLFRPMHQYLTGADLRKTTE
ncbi:MAG: hypothetical protein ACLS43_05980 [Evtepia gabavorous]